MASRTDSISTPPVSAKALGLLEPDDAESPDFLSLEDEA
jgi:hypothetical protein